MARLRGMRGRTPPAGCSPCERLSALSAGPATRDTAHTPRDDREAEGIPSLVGFSWTILISADGRCERGCFVVKHSKLPTATQGSQKRCFFSDVWPMAHTRPVSSLCTLSSVLYDSVTLSTTPLSRAAVVSCPPAAPRGAACTALRAVGFGGVWRERRQTETRDVECVSRCSIPRDIDLQDPHRLQGLQPEHLEHCRLQVELWQYADADDAGWSWLVLTVVSAHTRARAIPPQPSSCVPKLTSFNNCYALLRN
jgi:hypothetical protein